MTSRIITKEYIDFCNNMITPLAESPSETVVSIDKRVGLAASDSIRSLKSTDLYLLAEDFDGCLGEFSCEADEADEHFLQDFMALNVGMPTTVKSKISKPSSRQPVHQEHDTCNLERVGSFESVDRLNEIFTVTSVDWGIHNRQSQQRSTSPTSDINKISTSTTFAFDDLDEEFDAAVEVTPPFMDNSRNELFPSHQSPLSHGYEGCDLPCQSLGEHPKPSQSIPTVTSFDTCDTYRASNKSPKSSTECNHGSHARMIDKCHTINPTNNDVLFGRGGHTNGHAGNIRFRRMALKLRPLYEASSKKDKFNISNMLVEGVKKEGHRFAKRGSDGLWHEVTWKFARKKASQALRERCICANRHRHSCQDAAATTKLVLRHIL